MREINRAIKQIKYFNKSVETLKNTDLTKMSKTDFWINRLKYLAWYVPMCAIFIIAAYITEKDRDSGTLIMLLIFISLILMIPAILAIIIPYKIWKEQNKEEK